MPQGRVNIIPLAEERALVTDSTSDVIRYFGSRQKIFNVHFRNIRGLRDEFVETFPDDGDVDLVKAIQTYKEVGYPYLLMPDHVPTAPGDPGGLQSFAFCYGYIRALIQTVDRLE